MTSETLKVLIMIVFTIMLYEHKLRFILPINMLHTIVNNGGSGAVPGITICCVIYRTRANNYHVHSSA